MDMDKTDMIPDAFTAGFYHFSAEPAVSRSGFRGEALDLRIAEQERCDALGVVLHHRL